MTGKMTLVTLTNTTTSNTTTISSSTSHSCIDLTLSESTLPKPSVLPVQSTSVTVKDKKAKPRKIHTYDDYLICILKWPTSLIDELGLTPSIGSICSMHVRIVEIEMGLLYKEFLGENTYPVPLLELYSSFEEYEEITIPWLFEETFEEVRKHCQRVNRLASLLVSFIGVDQTQRQNERSQTIENRIRCCPSSNTAVKIRNLRAEESDPAEANGDVLSTPRNVQRRRSGHCDAVRSTDKENLRSRSNCRASDGQGAFT